MQKLEGRLPFSTISDNHVSTYTVKILQDINNLLTLLDDKINVCKIEEMFHQA